MVRRRAAQHGQRGRTVDRPQHVSLDVLETIRYGNSAGERAQAEISEKEEVDEGIES